MKKNTIAFIITCILFTYTNSASAKNYSMLFWYPGEAGSTVDAAPVLDEFFTYINSRLKGDSLSGKYINQTQKGLDEIKRTRPNFAIISYIAITENKDKIPQYQTIAKTKPLPSGRAAEQFTIVGAKNRSAEAQGKDVTIYTSIPMGINFFKQNLAPDFKGNINLAQSNMILTNLKKIASGEENDRVALLTPMEKHTFDNMNASWKESLMTIYTCRPIPTAELVYFGEKPAINSQLTKILTDMPANPEGAEILETLRLKGFQPVN